MAQKTCSSVAFFIIIAGIITLVRYNLYSYSGFGAFKSSPVILAPKPASAHENLVRFNVTTGELPAVVIAPWVRLKHINSTWKGLQLPVITAEVRGRMGNIMGEYATLYAIGRAYNVTVRLHPKMTKELKETFPYLSIPPVPDHMKRSEWTALPYYDLGSYGAMEAAAAGLLGPQRFIIQGWPFEIQLFQAYREDILRDLTFSPKIQNKVHQFWEAKRIVEKGSVLVGIHIRRTDYKDYIKLKNGHLPGEKYFRRSMAYYKRKFQNVHFIIASDDMSYVNRTFYNDHNVTFAPGKPKELDLAVLASCNHSIITLGSFGFWSGYLAGGLVLYPNITAKPLYKFQRRWYEESHLDFFIPIESD